MKCPYCGSEMMQGKVMALGLGSGLRWKDEYADIRLNDEPKLAALCNGDRISGYRCEKCKKILMDYHF